MAAAPDPLMLPILSSPRFGKPVQLGELKEQLEQVEEALSQGCIVPLMSQGRVIAELRSPSGQSESRIDPEMPDFMARMKEMWGDRIFGDSTRWLREDRDSGF